MIECIKLGLDNYKDGRDRNSGLFEFERIKEVVDKVSSYISEFYGCSGLYDVLIILNGKAESEEVEATIKKIDEWRNSCTNSKVIFVMSDSIALATCMDIISKCDYVFHQGIESVENDEIRPYIFDEIPSNVEQVYGYVPELFYASNIPYNRDQKDMILFGGNDLRREDKFKEYIYDVCGNIRSDVFLLTKRYATGYDSRIDYSSFKKLIGMFKFNLMISREEYRDSNWITARYFEAISNWSLPIIDFEFAKKFDFPEEIIIRNKYDLNMLMNSYCSDELDRVKIISKLRSKVNVKGFEDLITKIVLGDF